MERSKDWLDQAAGDLEHAKSDASLKYYNWACFSAHPSGSPGSRYTEDEAKRLIEHAEKIYKFCSDLLPGI